MTNKEKLYQLIIKDPKISKNKYVGSIYVLYNTKNSKIYVGKTVQDYRKRFYRHKSNAKLEHLEFLYNAIRKYGWENFEKFIIFQTEEVDDKDKIIDLINAKETYYIQYFKSNQREFGYNICSGGEGKTGTINNSCSIPILQCDLQGKVIKEWPSMHEVERQLGYSNKEISYFMYCNKRKSSYKGFLWIKKSDYFDGVFDDYVPRHKQTVYCYDFSGKLLKSFDSSYQAAKFYQFSISDIRKCCLGESLICKTIIFLNDPDELNSRLEKIKQNKQIYNRVKNKLLIDKKVYHYDINQNLIKIYNNVQEIATLFRIRPSMVCSKIEKDSALFAGGVLIWEDNLDQLSTKINCVKKSRNFKREYKKYYVNNNYIIND